MATVQEIAVSASINLLAAFAFLFAFAILRLQPVNDRVYFPKWYLKGIRNSPTQTGAVTKYVNLDWRTYVNFLNWMPAALGMPEPELIEHAGLDSVVYIRIYLLGLKIIAPLTVMAFLVLGPVHWAGGTLVHMRNLTFSDIDKLSISNVPDGSTKFWSHVVLQYAFTFWTFYVLYREYRRVATMRLRFLESQSRRPDQFTVLVRNIPPDPDESVSEHVEHFFCVNHPDYYLTHQVVYNANALATLVEKKKALKNWYTYYHNKYERTSKRPTKKSGYCGLFGPKVDAIDYYAAELQKLDEEEAAERERVMSDPKAIVPAAFVSFKSRWAAAVCAQTQLCRNPTIWLTEWAPEPRDVYWNNLAIPYFELSIRRLLMAVALFFLIFFFMIPIAFVQSLANVESIEKAFPFMKPLTKLDKFKDIVEGFLPGIVLKIFLIVLPIILMLMSRIEGFTSISSLERRSAGKYHLFILINVFLGSIITGSAFEQLKTFIRLPPTEMPKIIGVSIPMKATFFITYVMVDGWAGIAAEILRLLPLIIFHLKNTFLVKTEEDREQAMDPGSVDFAASEPRIQLYILLGFVYSVITPILLPFIIIFFAFSYLVSRHQEAYRANIQYILALMVVSGRRVHRILKAYLFNVVCCYEVINVYDQKYESGAAFWPDVHWRMLTSLIISQLTLMGLLSTKQLEKSTFVLLPLPILTIWFFFYCKGRFQSAFVKFPLEEAMIKDTLERATEPNFNLQAYLEFAYVHPVFKGTSFERPQPLYDDEEEEEINLLVPTKRLYSKHNSETSSLAGS